NTDQVAQSRYLPSIKEFGQMLITFMLVNLAWVFFRADNLSHAAQIFKKIGSSSILTVPDLWPTKTITLIILFIGLEWFQRDKEVVLDFTNWRIPQWARLFIYYLIIASIFLLGGKQQEFIYFQF